jgi:hypothetical protein
MENLPQSLSSHHSFLFEFRGKVFDQNFSSFVMFSILSKESPDGVEESKKCQEHKQPIQYLPDGDFPFSKHYEEEEEEEERSMEEEEKMMPAEDVAEKKFLPKHLNKTFGSCQKLSKEVQYSFRPFLTYRNIFKGLEEGEWKNKKSGKQRWIQ